MIYVVAYLSAIVCANILTATFGPNISVLNAFLFIGLDLTARDSLHDTWRNKNLTRNMALLIASGSILSWILNRNSGQIAIASFAAFGCAAIIDSLTYHRMWLRKWEYLKRVNGSNVFSSAVDSIVFPAIAFGFPLLWGIMLKQFVAKILGGLVWSLIISKLLERGDDI